MGDSPRASESGLSSKHMHRPYNFRIAPALICTFLHFEIFDVKHWNINKSVMVNFISGQNEHSDELFY